MLGTKHCSPMASILCKISSFMFHRSKLYSFATTWGWLNYFINSLVDYLKLKNTFLILSFIWQVGYCCHYRKINPFRVIQDPCLGLFCDNDYTLSLTVLHFSISDCVLFLYAVSQKQNPFFSTVHLWCFNAWITDKVVIFTLPHSV